MSKFTIKPLDVGVCKLGKDHVLGDEYSEDERVTFGLYSFLLESDGIKILVDLGSETLEYTNNMFRKYGFFRESFKGQKWPDDVVQNNGNIFDWLKRENIGVEEIDYIIFTHLHADHHGINDATDYGAAAKFPNAKTIISKKGWEDNLSRRVNDKWNSYVDYKFSDFLYEGIKKGNVIAEDNYLVCDGVKTHYLGGHSICSQGIKIPTEHGPAFVTSDDIYHYEFLKMAIVPRLHTSEENIIQTNKKMAEMALEENVILLPVHEPKLFGLYERDGSEWLVEARKLTSGSARGFMENL